MPAHGESRASRLRIARDHAVVARTLIDSASRVVRRSRVLCGCVRDLSRRPDFYRHLLTSSRVVPWMRRFLPIAGAGGEIDLLDIETQERLEGLVARVSGEVDLANVDRLTRAIRPAVETSRNIVLDVTGLRYIDSTGLHALLDAQRHLQAHGCRLLVAGASPSIGKVMRLFGFDKLIPLTASLESAMELLRSRGADSPADR
jgi:anti-anti-sigma factor